MGGRKRRLTYRKYTEKKSTCTTVPLVISLPLSSYTDVPVDSIETLYTRVTSFPLPPTWIINNAAKTPISICKLRISSGIRADILITLTINAEKDWVISFIHHNINPDNCSLLNKLPSTLSSVDSIISTLSLIDSSKVCLGNSDPSFLTSWQHRSLTLHNASGNYLNPFCMYIIPYIKFYR